MVKDNYFKLNISLIISNLKFSIPLQGKTEAIELKTVNSLVLLLKDEDVNVKCKSALALETYFNEY